MNQSTPHTHKLKLQDDRGVCATGHRDIRARVPRRGPGRRRNLFPQGQKEYRRLHQVVLPMPGKMLELAVLYRAERLRAIQLLLGRTWSVELAGAAYGRASQNSCDVLTRFDAHFRRGDDR